MKPPPRLAAFGTRARSNERNLGLQCRRNIHIRAIAPALSCHIWLDGSRSNTTESLKVREEWRRHASTSAAPVRKTEYGTVMAPPPPSKTTSHTKNPTKNIPAIKSSALAKPAIPTTVPAKRPSTSTTTVPTLKAKESVNPPHFTYAPEITVPARKAGQNIASYLWGAGRAYLNFYKSGISHVRQTSKLAKQLREKAGKSPRKSITEVLTRAEWQVVKRSRKDTLRLPAFGALVLLLGEWLPLVVLYITPLIPEPCRFPQQVERELQKIDDRRQARLRRVVLDVGRLMMKDPRPAGAGMKVNTADVSNGANAIPKTQVVHEMKLDDMTLFDLLRLSATHDCHAPIWDWTWRLLTPPKSLLRRNLRLKLEYLSRDDEMIERDGGWAALGKEEVTRACVERGVAVVGKREDELRRALAVQWKGGQSAQGGGIVNAY